MPFVYLVVVTIGRRDLYHITKDSFPAAFIWHVLVPEAPWLRDGHHGVTWHPDPCQVRSPKPAAFSGWHIAGESRPLVRVEAGAGAHCAPRVR
jgi:hypothetical protein